MIVLLGKSASGKTTVYNELLKLGFYGITTFTTRPMRKGEKNGVTYNFITKEQFLSLKSKDFFAETSSYNVATGETWYYGTARKDINKDSVIIVNPDGFAALSADKSLGIVSFYLKVDEKTIEDRLNKRDDNHEEAVRRMGADRKDFYLMESRTDFVIRNDLGMSPKEVAEIIKNIYEAVNKSHED